MTETGRIAELVDLERYPIAELSSPEGLEVVGSCRAQMAAQGLCLLPGFIRAAAVEAMAADARSVAQDAHHTDHWRATPHGDGGPEAGTIPHATRAAMGTIAYDRLAPEAGLRTLYQWEGFTAFLRAAMDNPTLYPCADPMVSCIVTICREGDELGWHYDPNDGVVSLLLQAAGQGGGFEFVPDIRRSGAEATAWELEVLEGRDPDVIRPLQEAGTLSLFNGHRSLHRVAPVGPGRERIMAILSYSDRPGYVFSPDIRAKFFGRTA